MYVIGVAGQAQMGKDTLADRLCDKMNDRHNNQYVQLLESMQGSYPDEQQQDFLASFEEDPWKRSAFASAVKRVYCETFDVDMAFIEKWKTVPEAPPGFDMPVRQSLQFIGDGFRNIRGSIWLDLAFRDKETPIIISDVRYVNEFKRVKAEGGMNILIARPEKLNDDPNGSEAQIRPYIDFCLKYFYETEIGCKIFTPEDWEDIKNNPSYDKPPEGIECFDLFVCNCGTKDELYETVDKFVVPFAESYDFKNEEEQCLTSS